MEVGAENAELVEEFVKANAAFELAETIKDIAGLPRVCSTTQKKRKARDCVPWVSPRECNPWAWRNT